MSKRVGGIIFVKSNGQQLKAKGSWNYNLGQGQREEVVGSDSVHGFKETPQAPFISGVVTDTDDLNMKELLNIKDATVQLELANGKIVVLEQAFFAGEGTGSTEEGEIETKFVGISAEEIR